MADDPKPPSALEGLFTATLDQVTSEADKIPEAHRAAYHVSKSAERLYRLVAMGAPELIIEAERRILHKRVSELPCYCADYDELMRDRSPDSAKGDGQ